MERFKNLSLKNKIFLSTLAVILLISVLIALLARWVLVSSLTFELKRRGMGIAQSIAESSRSYILTEDTAGLTSLAFDSLLGERKPLIVYIFILDKQNNVLSHTFTHAFPEGLQLANRVQPDQTQSIRLLRIGGHSVHDIAVPVKEGIYQIGTVHVGLNKTHIDQLISKLRITFLGFLSAIAVIFFLISHRLSLYITRPVSELTAVSDEISRGNLDIEPHLGKEIVHWRESKKKGRAGDEVMQLADSFINMTNRLKISQFKLKESEEKYRSLFNSGPNPIFVLDRETLEIVDANPSAEETYGYSKDELIGRSFIDLGFFEDDKTGLSLFTTETKGDSSIVHSKVRHYKKGRKPFYVNVHACAAKYRDRDAMIIATTDITEMIEKDTQLIQASKMTTLGEMSAGIAHELNQPLNAIKMGSEYLKMMVEDGRKIQEQDLFQVADDLSSQVDRATGIIDRLRDFGRKADFTRERIEINRPIKNVLDLVRKQLSLQNIQVQLELDENLPAILAHNNRLEQVFFNLVTNARDAINQKRETGAGSRNHVICIRSFREDERVAVLVSDTGIGIQEPLKERIFEAFFTTKKLGEGLGLGLAIAYGIVKDYGGDIRVESQEGDGTTFKLTFPCARA
jgi:PAS domain S-box-containing protein